MTAPRGPLATRVPHAAVRRYTERVGRLREVLQGLAMSNVIASHRDSGAPYPGLACAATLEFITRVVTARCPIPGMPLDRVMASVSHLGVMLRRWCELPAGSPASVRCPGRLGTGGTSGSSTSSSTSSTSSSSSSGPLHLVPAFLTPDVDPVACL
ncbi:MAG: hypothetical protein WDW36_007506 [Sanguina aurantia]